MDNMELEQALKGVEARLQAELNSDVQLLYDASHHIVVSGGKRLRPRIVMLAYLAAGGTDLDVTIPVATSVELVHTATLVHDDINDHSDLRRGRATINSIWGRTFALLTGDYFFAKVYEAMAPYGTELNVIMAQAAVRLVEGETLQALAAKNGTMDRETYKQIIDRKTASLFEASARMGAMLAGADEETVEGLASYGRDLGLTYQLTDDILDIVGDPDKLGKPVGLDLVQQRGVMSVQNGNGNGNGNGHSYSNGGVAEAIRPELKAMDKIMEKVRSTGAVEVARLQAREMGRRAKQSLNVLPASEYKQELAAMVDLVLDRDN